MLRCSLFSYHDPILNEFRPSEGDVTTVPGIEFRKWIPEYVVEKKKCWKEMDMEPNKCSNNTEMPATLRHLGLRCAYVRLFRRIFRILALILCCAPFKNAELIYIYMYFFFHSYTFWKCCFFYSLPFLCRLLIFCFQFISLCTWWDFMISICIIMHAPSSSEFLIKFVLLYLMTVGSLRSDQNPPLYVAHLLNSQISASDSVLWVH